jgi:WD40 repeat protein
MESNPTPPISVIPKFAFGIKGDMRNNIFFLDDQRIIYPCGHNVVILTIGDDKYQDYIPCIEGSEGITAMALSNNKSYLAVCERSERAICSIYAVNTKKRRKVITTDYITDKEFISVAFSHQNEKGHLVTLTGGQDGMVILWQWNKGKCIAYQKVGISEDQTLYQASFNREDFNSLVVTGNGVYKYYKLKDNGLRPEHSGLAKKESHISNHYTCH